MPLQVWLLNPYQIKYPWAELVMEVQSLMRPVVERRDKAHKHKLGSVSVSNRYTRPPVGARDLAAYIVPAKNYGFVGVGFGSGGREDSSGGLTTYDGGQVCSEVYLGEEVSGGSNAELIKVERMTNTAKGVYVDKRRAPKFVAKIVFHELLHNVTPLWNETKLHHTGGVSIGLEGVGSNSAQSDKDISILADNLDAAVARQRQWVGAWDYLISDGWPPQS